MVSSSRDADWVARLCVPCSETHHLLQETHDSPWETAHAGVARLFLKLTAHFYWPWMWAEIVNFTRMCNVCQKTKPDMQGLKGKLLPHSIPLLPYDVVSLDLITGLLNSEGFDAVLGIVDKLMKYILYSDPQNCCNVCHFWLSFFITPQPGTQKIWENMLKIYMLLIYMCAKFHRNPSKFDRDMPLTRYLCHCNSFVADLWDQRNMTLLSCDIVYTQY